MKIIQINASYKPAFIYGGPTMSVSKLTEELVRGGIDSEVFTTTANGETELKLQAGIKTIVDGVSVTYFRRITKGNSHFSPALLGALWRKLKNNGEYSETEINGFLNTKINKSSNSQTLVHIHAWWNLVSVGSCFIAILRSRQVILSPRGTLGDYSFANRAKLSKNAFHLIIGKTLLKQCHFHVSSEKEKQDILNIIQPKSITVIPNFVNLGSRLDTNELTDLNCNSKPFKLLFFSRVEEKKGLDILLNALSVSQLEYHLTIAGTGNTNYILFLKTLAADLGITNRISWIGQQSNEDKFDILADHDLLVLPSHDESFANVVIESLSVGTPVLISSKVGLADYVKSNNFGWVYHFTPEHLAKALKSALQDTEKRKRISLQAPQKIILDFDEQHLLKKYVQLYNKISDYV